MKHLLWYLDVRGNRVYEYGLRRGMRRDNRHDCHCHDDADVYGGGVSTALPRSKPRC